MKRKLVAPSLETHVDIQSEQFHKNRSDMLEQLEELEELESSVAHDPIKTKIPEIKKNQKCKFLITFSLS